MALAVASDSFLSATSPSRASATAALPDSISRSAALLEAAGFAVIEPLHPIREVWHLVAHTAQHPGLLWPCSPPRPTPAAPGSGCPAAIIPAPGD